MPRLKLTDLYIQNLKPGPARTEHRDTQVPGLLLRVSPKSERHPAGLKTWVCGFRLKDPNGGVGERIKTTLGTYPGISLEQARIEAGQYHKKAREGINHREVARARRDAQRRQVDEETRLRWSNIVELYLSQRVRKSRRSAAEIERILTVYTTEWNDRAITSITRSDVASLLDKVENRQIKNGQGKRVGGPVQCDRVLANVRALMRWWQARDDHYIAPIVPGMARTSPKERARRRILSDDEIRALWAATHNLGTFDSIVRVLLLTAQRRSEIAKMRWGEIGNDGVLRVPPERFKTGATVGEPNVVPLPPAAREIIEHQPTYAIDGRRCPFVFTQDGANPFGNFSKAKNALDAAMLGELQRMAAARGEDLADVKPPGWVLHDLRRTARSLLSRLQVDFHIAERVLGHVIGGVAETYDRHTYEREKARALEQLATEIDRITTSDGGKIIPMKRHRGSTR